MESMTLTPTQEQILDFVHTYRRSLSQSKNPHMDYFFRLEGATVSIYKSGKVLLQGNDLTPYLAFFGQDAGTSKGSTTSSAGQDLAMIGTDEVGNGSYFGGLTVVASFVTPDQHDWLKKLGVGDSKTLDDRKIQQLAPLLEENIQHQALLLSPKKYNEVIASGYNAVSVKVALHNQAIYLLLNKGVQAERIVIDAFTTAKNYQKYVKAEKNQVTQAIELEEKAEGKYLSVAVSSIIARNLFLQNLEDLGKELGFNLPSGAGAKSDQVAAKLLQTYGMKALDYCAKLHFKNTEKAKKLLER
ncbi:ribonuclease HIII [Streptococcus parasanguinis]|uniref:ribonuclease HIII n=1 Tax=Streptococcus parasanguinis TaxID=1318 RepID=UPI001BDA40D6|nr:ribonuclease HIII [Streptococcus parasanguinis]MBT0907591.1 ribonuclease HIII [Streptococcus parasanguinis]MBT0925902.1 ribonuclease HIII [Streptococcus parasanguinis]